MGLVGLAHLGVLESSKTAGAIKGDRLMTEVPAQMAIPPKMDYSSNGWSLLRGAWTDFPSMFF